MTDMTVLKEKLIRILHLQDMRPEDIDDDIPLFNEGLGLDSVDAFNLALGMEDEYGVEIKSVHDTRKAFASTRALARYIDENAAERPEDRFTPRNGG